MTIEQAFIALLSVTSGVGGWLVHELWSAVKSLRSDLDTLRVHMAEHYVSDDRLAKAMQPVVDQLTRIEQALHLKVNKS